METETDLQADEIETPPHSKNIKRYGFRRQGSVLIVEFQSGARYEYPNVPREVFDQMRHAPSAGSFLAKEVKDQFAAHKVETKQGAGV